MTQDEKEIQFLTEAVATAKALRTTMMRHMAFEDNSDFIMMRQLDMDIKLCEDELRRSPCHS